MFTFDEYIFELIDFWGISYDEAYQEAVLFFEGGDMCEG